MVSVLIGVLLFIILASQCVCVVPRGSVWTVERAGKGQRVWEAGLHFRLPLADRMARKAPADHPGQTG